MKKEDKEYCIKRYSERYKQYGYSSLALGWGLNGKQNLRFLALSEIGISPDSSVLDIGCGFGDLFKYLIDNNWKGNYLGVDLVEDLLSEAKKQNPTAKFENTDILNDGIKNKFDFVVSSGIFNAKLINEDSYQYIERMLIRMLRISNKGVAVDFLSTYVDFEHKTNFHSDPAIIFKIAKSLSKRVAIRHDYLPFEFSLYIYKDDQVDSSNLTFLK